MAKDIKSDRMDHVDKGLAFGKPIKNNEERNRRLKQAYVVILLVSIAYYTDRFIGTYTGDWKVYAYVIGGIFAVGAGYITITDFIERIISKKK